jgi:tetratricopeptide (TPR) repeat protein
MKRNLIAGLCIFSFMGSPLCAANLGALEARARAGEVGAVLAELDVLLDKQPEESQALFLKARLLAQQDKTDAAIAVYRQLIKQQPNFPEPYNNLAALLIKKGDLAAAQANLEKAMKTHPSYAVVYENLSTVYVELARDSYGKALHLEQATKQIQLAQLNELRFIPTPAVLTVAQAEQKQTSAPAPAKNNVPAKPVETPVSPPPVVTPTIAVTPQAPVPSPTAQTVATAANKDTAKSTVGMDNDQIMTTLHGWAAAWSAKSAELYFSFYADDFSPPGMTRSTWKTQRHDRLQEPKWIKVNLKDFKIKPLKGKRASVRLTQEYQAEGYRDRIRKELVLHYTVDGWRIIAERKIAALP